MKIAIIVCTYQRPLAVSRLLESVEVQTNYPDQILVIDGSFDDETLARFRESELRNLHYYKVPDEHRGLTKAT